jgi:hypothetical protein
MAQTGIAASLGVTSVPMRFVRLPPACGSEEMQGQTGILAALAMPPTIGSRFEVRGSPNRRPHGYHILRLALMWLIAILIDYITERDRDIL